MAQNYFSLVTNAGKIKLAASAAGGDPLTITHFAIGDGGGAETNPTAAATALVNEVWRTPVESVETDPDNPSAVLVKAIIPTNDGGWWMREFGIFDAAGDMIAVAKPVSQYKPTALEGQLEDILYEFQVIIGDNAKVTLLVDPSVLLASRAWVAARKIPMGQMMRAGYRSAEAFSNDPPVGPQPGQTWVVGTEPTGVFEGHDNELAEWSGATWSFAAPGPWFHVGLADRTDWRWDSTLAEPAWVNWTDVLASQMGDRKMDIFLEPGTSIFVVPPGVHRLWRVRVWGAGGGGGGSSDSSSIGGGGGGGAYGELSGIAVTPGQEIPVTCGAGGVGGPPPGSSGGTGGTSSFGTFITCEGGTPGAQFSRGNGAPAPIFPTGIALPGGRGYVGGIFNEAPMSGPGGSSPFGGGVTVSTATSGGIIGNVPGGGGCGAGAKTGGNHGGTGANGMIIVEY